MLLGHPVWARVAPAGHPSNVKLLVECPGRTPPSHARQTPADEHSTSARFARKRIAFAAEPNAYAETRGARANLKLLVGVLAVATVVGSSALEASAQQTTARTCITDIATNIGTVRVLRKIGPKQSCPVGEDLYTWERSGQVVQSGSLP
jgi:hypothetical protein